MTVYVIIPVHNRRELTLKCLWSLQSQNYKDYKIIVIDDGSTDGTADIVENDFPDIILLKGDGNLWWSGATNLGIEYILENAKKEDLVLTLNNDLEVSPVYLENIVDCYKKNRPALIGSISVSSDYSKKVYYSGVKWNRLTAKYRRNFNTGKRLDIVSLPEVLETDLLPGRGTLIPVELFRKIGKYDERHFPQYIADEDFSLRAKDAGYKLLVCSNAVVYSHIEATGVNFNINKPTIRNFIVSLFSIRSANNIKIRFYFAMKHSSCLPVYFLFDLLRLFLSFFRAMIRYRFKIICQR
ncbi:glycosyltransferase family 2 protein [Elusimicrobiota bacterium]